MARRRKIDNAAVVVNAVGITDAFNDLADSGGDRPLGSARYQDLLDRSGGWIGLAMQLAEAARWMEEWCCTMSDGSAWGAGWPQIYEVWDAVAAALWANLYNGLTVAEIVKVGIQAAIEKEAAHGNA